VDPPFRAALAPAVRARGGLLTTVARSLISLYSYYTPSIKSCQRLFAFFDVIMCDLFRYKKARPFRRRVSGWSGWLVAVLCCLDYLPKPHRTAPTHPIAKRALAPFHSHSSALRARIW
jgi:hypothetical protein